MSKTILIQFVESGIAENPFIPRFWSFVPRVGETVTISETGLSYRVLAVEWTCTENSAGDDKEHEPQVTIRIAQTPS